MSERSCRLFASAAALAILTTGSGCTFYLLDGNGPKSRERYTAHLDSASVEDISLWKGRALPADPDAKGLTSNPPKGYQVHTNASRRANQQSVSHVAPSHGEPTTAEPTYSLHGCPSPSGVWTEDPRPCRWRVSCTSPRDPPASQQDLAIVEGGGLPGGDRRLGGVEGDGDSAV